MATREEAEVTVSSSYDPSITIGLAVSSSKSSKYAVKWALENFVDGDRTRFMLIHVRQKVTLIPTPMGNYVPIDQVREDIASAYEKEVECQAQNMLLMYKNMCEQKVEAEVLVVKGDDVADTISGVVSACQINKLVVGVSSQGKLMRKSKGARTSSKICKSVPSFCSVFAVSKGGLSMVYSPGSEGGNSSEIFQFYESSNSGLHSDDKSSISDNVPSRTSGSNLSGDNLDSSSHANHNRPHSLHEYLTGGCLTSSILDKNQSSSPCARDQIAEPINLPISGKAQILSNALQELMLSEDKANTPCASGQIPGSSNFLIRDKAPTEPRALRELMLAEDKLLTAKPAVGLSDIVEQAVEEDRLVDILDQRAGVWPLQEAHDLAQLGLSCLEMRSRDRPDLEGNVLAKLKRLNNIASTAFDPLQPFPNQTPFHFICPILKRVMLDPCIASDGHSYDRAGIETWLCENEVSPLTKMQLPDKNLIPNYALLSAVNSWKAEGGGDGTH